MYEAHWRAGTWHLAPGTHSVAHLPGLLLPQLLFRQEGQRVVQRHQPLRIRVLQAKRPYRRALQLLPFAGAPNDIPEPEYALLDGSALLYYVAR